MVSAEVTGIIAFVILFVLELLFPFYDQRHKVKHDVANVLIMVMNVIVIALLFSGLVFLVTEFSNKGLLHQFVLPFWVEAVIAFLLFDLWMYWWHVLNHKIPFLWRFHRMHHSDKKVDASSALRFHFGEIFFSSVLRLPVFLLIGMSMGQIVLYEAVLLPVIMFHHSNVKVPRKLDVLLRLFIATPSMHRVHHSVEMEEYDSSYGSVFSFWDRLFGSFTLKEEKKIEQGLKNFQEEEWHDVKGMMKTPFVKKDKV